MERKTLGMFGYVRKSVFARNISGFLLLSCALPWQAFADDQLFRQSKENFTPRPFIQPDLSTGAFTYARSVTVPPGRAGIQPDIKLIYNSSATRQDSIAGYGWSLNIPYIERLNKNGVDKLFNQDIAHSFFSSSLSGELFQIATTTAVSGSFLGFSFSRLALGKFLPRFAQLDPAEAIIPTSPPPPAVPPVPTTELETVISTSTSQDTSAIDSTLNENASTTSVSISSIDSTFTENASTTPDSISSNDEATSTSESSPVDMLPILDNDQGLRSQPQDTASPTWVYSQELVRYDTADGDLHPGMYALQQDGKEYIAYMATTTVTTATTTYDIPAHLSSFPDKSSFDGMTEVHDIGRKYVDAFSDGVNILKVDSTSEAYTDLNKLNAPIRTYTAPVSTTAILGRIFSTSDLATALKSFVGLKTAYAAIAHDNAQSYTSCVTGTSCTYSYTVTGTDTFLVCNTSSYTTSPGATTMSYAGQAMTEIGSQQVDTSASNNFVMDTFYLKGAPSGSNNLVITTTNSMTNGFYAHCSSYTGTDQIDPIEASTQHITNYSTCTSDNTTLTTVADNSWVIGIWGDDAGRTHTAGAGTLRTSDGQGVIIDIGPKTPAGSATVTNIPQAGTGCPATGIAIKLSTVFATGLQVELQSNPTVVATSNPRFSALYQNLASTTAIVTSYQIQVATSSASYGVPYWDSAMQTLSSSTPPGQRTPEIFSTTTFSLDRTKYYWRIRFFDQIGSSTPWSGGGDYFIMTGRTDYGAKVESGDFLSYTLTTANTWEAIDKRGVKYVFGTASSSRVATSTSVFRWYLDSMTDPNGNSMAYTYTTDSNQVYPSKITYTSNGASAEIGEVDFIYETRPDIATSSSAGFSVTTKQRIKEILVYANGQLTRRYQLGYTSGDNTTRSLLSTFTESGWNATAGTTTLPAAFFTYATSTDSYTENTATTTKWVQPSPGCLFVDSNGVDMASRVLDANGDALPDLILGCNAYVNNGTSWTLNNSYAFPISPTASGQDIGVRFGDVNGDGMVDQVKAISCYPGISCGATAQNVVYLGSAGGWTLSALTLPVTFVSSVNNGSYYDYGYALADINGDGLADITGASGAYINNGSQWISDSAWALPVALTSGLRDNGVRLADVNGDGLADVVVGNLSTTATYLNSGHGWSISAGWAPPVPFIYGYGDLGTRLVDMNGDGLLDIVGNDQYVNTGYGWTLRNLGFPEAPVQMFPSWWSKDLGLAIDDINGDGLPDVIQSTENTDLSVRKHVYLKDGVKADLLKKVTSEKGGATSIAYGRTNQIGSDGVLQNPSLAISFDTVKTVAIDPGFGGKIATTTYAYKGGLYYYASKDDRQFAAFATSTQTNDQGHTTRTSFHQGNTSNAAAGEFNDHVSKIGKPYLIETLDSTSTSANLYSRTINKWARADYGDGRNFAKLAQSIKQIWDGNSTHRDTAASSTYDNTNGNLLIQDNFGEVAGSADGTFTDIGADNATTTYTYAASSTLSTMSLPSRELVVDRVGNTVKDTKWYYDSLATGLLTKGNQTKEERLISGSTYASTTKTYDTYGNVLTFADPMGNVTTNVYDAFNLYPATTTNALGHTTVFLYNYGLGKVATTTDANNFVFSTLFDGLGRPTLEKQPDFLTPTTLVTKSTYTYTDSTTTPSSVLRKDYVNSATTSDSYSYFDGLGRAIQTKKEAEVANGWITNDTIYNNIGSVASSSLPYFTAASTWGSPTSTSALFVSSYYDSMGRVATITNAVGTTKNIYDDWKLTIVDPLNNKKDLIKDAHGNLAQVVEYLSASNSGTTTNTWNLLGKLTKLTDASANIRNFTYDNLGRLLTSEDLHTSADTLYGTTTYTYDVAGNLTTKLTPNNHTINYVYDVLNRLTSEDYTGGSGTEITNTYDTCTNGKGRLCASINQGGATTTYEYNPIGLTGTTSTQIGTTWGTTTTSFFRNGAQDTLVYPNNQKVMYIYNDAGMLNKVLSLAPASTTWRNVIESTNYAPNGQPSFIDYGNNTATTWTYDATKLYRLIRKFTQSTSTTAGVPESLSL